MLNPTFRLLDESFGLQTLYTLIVPEALMRRHVRPPICTKEFRRGSWHGRASLKAYLLEMFDYGKGIIKVVQQPLPFVIVRRLSKSHRMTLDVSPLDQQQIPPRHFKTSVQLMGYASIHARNNLRRLSKCQLEIAIHATLDVQHGCFKNHGSVPLPHPQWQSMGRAIALCRYRTSNGSTRGAAVLRPVHHTVTLQTENGWPYAVEARMIILMTRQ